jgi:hypothetical protein
MAENFKVITSTLTTTTSTVIYTCPAGSTAIVIMAQIANKDLSSSADASAFVYDYSANTSTYLGRNITVPLYAALNILSGKLVLEANDQFRAGATLNGVLDIVLSVLEITQ